jgi:hypothetical protein
LILHRAALEFCASEVILFWQLYFLSAIISWSVRRSNQQLHNHAGYLEYMEAAVSEFVHVLGWQHRWRVSQPSKAHSWHRLNYNTWPKHRSLSQAFQSVKSIYIALQGQQHKHNIPVGVGVCSVGSCSDEVDTQ